MFLKIWTTSKFIIFTTLAVLILIFFDTFFDNIHFVVGGIMILYGLEAFILEFVKTHHILRNSGLFWGLSEITIGLCLLFAVRSEPAIYAIWAMWSIMRESDEIRRHVIFWKKDIYTPVATIEALVVIVLSIILLVTLELHHARIHLYLLVVELITVTILPLLHNYRLHLANKKENKDK